MNPVRRIVVVGLAVAAAALVGHATLADAGQIKPPPAAMPALPGPGQCFGILGADGKPLTDAAGTALRFKEKAHAMPVLRSVDDVVAFAVTNGIRVARVGNLLVNADTGAVLDGVDPVSGLLSNEVLNAEAAKLDVKGLLPLPAVAVHLDKAIDVVEPAVTGAALTAGYQAC